MIIFERKRKEENNLRKIRRTTPRMKKNACITEKSQNVQIEDRYENLYIMVILNTDTRRKRTTNNKRQNSNEA
jgi:hypothetical protein